MRTGVMFRPLVWEECASSAHIRNTMLRPSTGHLVSDTFEARPPTHMAALRLRSLGSRPQLLSVDWPELSPCADCENNAGDQLWLANLHLATVLRIPGFREWLVQGTEAPTHIQDRMKSGSAFMPSRSSVWSRVHVLFRSQDSTGRS